MILQVALLSPHGALSIPRIAPFGGMPPLVSGHKPNEVADMGAHCTVNTMTIYTEAKINHKMAPSWP